MGLGRPGLEVGPEIWDTIGLIFARIMATGEGAQSENELLPVQRRGYAECYFNFTFMSASGYRRP